MVENVLTFRQTGNNDAEIIKELMEKQSSLLSAALHDLAYRLSFGGRRCKTSFCALP